MTNPKRPNKIWVSKSQILYVAYVLHDKVKAPNLIFGQWILQTHGKRNTYVLKSDTKARRNCGIWQDTKREDR